MNFKKILVIVGITIISLLFLTNCDEATKPNQPPNAVFTVNPSIGNIETIFVFDATNSEDNEDNLDELQFRWDWESDEQWDTDFSNIATIQHSYNSLGSKTITLEVIDTKGESSTYSQNISIQDSPPSADFIFSPEAGNVGTIFTFDASLSQDIEDPTVLLQVRWDWESDGSWDTDYSNDKVITYTFTSSGSKNVSLEVIDTYNNSDTVIKSVSIDVLPPTADFNISSTTGTTNTIFEFDASSSSDPEDPIELLQVRWDWENDGTWDTQYSTTKTATHQFGNVELFSVNMEIINTHEITSNVVKTVNVLQNTSPTASFQVNPQNGNTDAEFVFNASSSSDPEDDLSDLLFRWDWNNDGNWDTSFSSLPTITHQFSNPNDYTVVLEVKDPGDLTDTFSNSIHVDGIPIANFSVTPSSGAIGTQFTFDASSSTDNEDSINQLLYRWDWTSDGSWDTNYSHSYIQTHPFNSMDNFTVTLEVKDTFTNTSTFTDQVTVYGNQQYMYFDDGSFEGEVSTDNDYDTIAMRFFHTSYWEAIIIESIEVYFTDPPGSVRPCYIGNYTAQASPTGNQVSFSTQYSLQQGWNTFNISSSPIARPSTPASGDYYFWIGVARRSENFSVGSDYSRYWDAWKLQYNNGSWAWEVSNSRLYGIRVTVREAAWSRELNKYVPTNNVKTLE